MKKLVLIAAAMLVIPGAMAQGMTSISKFNDKPIRGLLVNGAFEVRLSQGEKSSARVEIFEELQDKMIFEYTEEGFIRLDFKDDVTKYLAKNKNKPTAHIVVEELRHCGLTGACNLIAKGKFSTEGEVVLRSTGTSYMTWINVDCGSASVDIAGNSKVEDVTVNAGGNVVVGVAGTASAALKTDCKGLVIGTSGAAKLALTGKASETVKLEAAGTSSIDMLGFESPKHEAEVKGLSKVRANVTGTSTVNVGNTASYRFTGSGSVTGSGAKRLD